MNVESFVTESNRIEGIHRPPTAAEVSATAEFIHGDKPTVESLCELAVVYAGELKGKLRDAEGMNVRVGSHIAPKGGARIRANLVALLKTIDESDPFDFHVAYETLHPFMDGNGRTGRALWAWQMWRDHPEMLSLNFLHAFYYQTLAAQRRNDQLGMRQKDVVGSESN